MTPTTYLAQVRRLARADDMEGILAFAQAHMTEALFHAMTPQQGRLADAANHVAADALGIGAEGPGVIPVDDLVGAAS